MHKKELEDLLERYNAGNATKAERDLVETWYVEYELELPAVDVPQKEIDRAQNESIKDLLSNLRNSSPALKLWPRYAAAACILAILSLGVIYLKKSKTKNVEIAAIKKVSHDILPGGNKAILTLADGSSIVISGDKKGTLASQNGTVITKTKDGQIRYQNTKGKSTVPGLAYNTAATPRGGKYQLILSDGTKVWLNSASSIKYPVEFAANERRVELTGEAYFEVAHDKHKPFSVVSNGQTVEVLGTHFNINAYADESEVKTTLLAGSVKVSSAGVTSVLKPGDQSQFAKGKISITQVDVDEAVAWKAGYFNFKDDNIETVMRQLARWYDVNVKYEGTIPPKEYSGQISMNLTASQILDILSFNKTHYRIDGKTIVITP
ncbi:FecR family protein [Mucilaginibacter frigoritolerans]|uniref:FecR family protein n=1 Tax=Mucilaginibacter frigoritolerans TaxID=652788 RepID=A0A562TKM7_9SPHI|nr:FecR family protein [Mucilaginibacter frigoritolerans]TWI93923.1 FecR family protein [Mucilaginibacter frigoritolerans]